MRVAPEKTDHAILRVHSDAIAISIVVRRRNDGSHRNALEFADSLEGVTNLSPFNRKLMFVANVLVSASPAAAEIGTLRFHTIRRGLLYFDQLRFSELLLLAHDFRGNDLALNSVKNKNRLALFSRDSFAAAGDVFDF